jgi:hypothetical protein
MTLLVLAESSRRTPVAGGLRVRASKMQTMAAWAIDTGKSGLFSSIVAAAARDVQTIMSGRRLRQTKT